MKTLASEEHENKNQTKQIADSLSNLAGFLDILIRIDLDQKHGLSEQTKSIIQNIISNEGQGNE